jgi:tetratricopeptide (TPR) repeat protein
MRDFRFIPRSRAHFTMTYPGNPALSPEIQQRILDTFSQTVELAEHGSSQEAILGCDFILRLDPSFEPARVLRGRLEDAGDRPVDVDDIKTVVPDVFEETKPEPLVPVADTDLTSEVEPQAETDPVKAEILQAYENRDFQRTLSLISDHQAEYSGDTEIRTIRSEASSRLEAEPYVKNFIDQARIALQDGNSQKAAEWIEKARSLDPSHPDLEEMETVQGFYEDPELKMGYRRTTGGKATEGEAIEEAEPSEDEEEAPAEPTPTAPPAGDAEQAPTTESAQRIAELLAEGQVSFDEHDYQGAIDVWSRIFLIDIDHEEATRRIEQARQLKAEGEREIEEIYHEGLSCAERGDVDGARTAFQKVLQLQPQHVAARDQLKLLESAKPGAPSAVPQVAAQPEEGVADEFPVSEETLFDAQRAQAAGAPQQRAPARPAATAAKRSALGGRAFIWIGGLVLLVVVVAGWLLYSQRQNIFPNAKPTAAKAQQASSGPIGRAKRLQAAGKVDLAIRLLQGILPDNPDYAQAQTLIAQWQAPAAGGEASEQDLAGREDLIAQAQSAHQQGDDLSAGKLIDHAAAIAPLVGDSAKLADSIHGKLAPVEKEIELFQNNDWEYALPDLWRMHEANPQDRVVNQLLVNGYYNLAVRDLQRNSPENALEKVQEALNLAPHDEHLQRVKAFAETYEHQPRDLRYRLYVKYLPFR